MIRPGEAERVIKTLYDAYLVQRNTERSLACLTENIQWVGTGKSEMVCGRGQVREALLAEFEQSPEPCRIEYERMKEELCSDRCAVVLFTATVYPGGSGREIFWFRVSAACVEEPDGVCRIASIHASTPDARQEDGDFFPASGLSREEIEYRLGAKALDILGRSIPGGMMGVYLEPEQPLYYVNDRILYYLGYTYEDFIEAIDGKIINCIHPDDRSRVEETMADILSKGQEYEIQYRMQKKGGSYIWVKDVGMKGASEDGRQVCISVIRDISGEVEARERLKEQAEKKERLAAQVEASNEILHLALEHTAACEFYYYPDSGECIVPERTRKIYGCRSRYTDMPESFANEMVAEEYRPEFYEMYERIHSGDRTAYCEFRGLGGGFWCRVTLSVIQYGEDGMPGLVVGISENITRQKKVEEELVEARSKDGLTGLYNKECGVSMVQDYLNHKAPGEHGVLMLLDMDDFEEINQKEGNVFADTILQEVSDILRAETKADDIRIRLGGDEFMLFVKDSNKAQARILGPEIARQVKGILENTEKQLHVSVSIGMCSTEVVEEYNALYRCAESTLKYVKEHGKGQAACYLDTSNELGVFLTQLYTEKHPVNAIELDAPHLNDDLISLALDLLGKAKNLDDAVFLLLSRIGKTFGFDRVSIIEANRAYLSYRFSYQWARNRADLQLGQDFYVSDEDFDICANMYDEDGLADYNVREGISHIASCLHAAIWNYGEYVGSMSFEVDQKNYRWTKEQRKLLKELVKIVPSFIMKSKADAVSQAKTDFLSRMSHEIRTPMNAISGMTTIAKSVLSNREKTLECLDKIEAANLYLLNLINDILDMSRIESGKMELNYKAMDLGEQLTGLESLFQSQAEEKHLKLKFINGYRENRLLRADSLRLNQVLVNIIGNAIKFTERGEIVVRVDAEPAGNMALIRFSVADTGIGIEPEVISRIFNAFEQAEAATAARHGGTGLGLSISSRLVQMMGGTLEVSSQPGVGSEFYFTLSLEYVEEEAKGKAEAAAPMDFSGRRILLAEDNEMNREIAQTILEMNGFLVVSAANGREALEQFLSGEPGWLDAVLMDIRMPVMDGLEATQRIRTSGRPDARDIPIIALTANAFDEDTKKSIDSGMNGHLSKPIAVDKLFILLEDCIGRREQRTGVRQDSEA